jgi:L-threonylcarbamoyladenylate synthase
MEIISWKRKDDAALRRHLVARLRQGEVLMLPTDTIYGLSCRADKEKSIARIFNIKRRDRGKPLLVLVSSLSMARKFCRINKGQMNGLKIIWQNHRPSSVLLPHRGLLPQSLTAGSSELAVRLPKSIFLRKMIRALGVPLVSTSANFSGKAVLDAVAAKVVFKKEPRPDLLLSGGKNSARASRLLRLRPDGGVEILRK